MTAATATTGPCVVLLVVAANQVGAFTSAMRMLVESPDLRGVIGRRSCQGVDRCRYGLAVQGIVPAYEAAIRSRWAERA